MKLLNFLKPKYKSQREIEDDYRENGAIKTLKKILKEKRRINKPKS